MKKKKRIGLPPPGPADLKDGFPWILAKSIVTGRCKCFNSDKVIPNQGAYFILDYHRQKELCERRLKDCNRIQI